MSSLLQDQALILKCSDLDSSESKKKKANLATNWSQKWSIMGRCILFYNYSTDGNWKANKILKWISSQQSQFLQH
jgi:hypothetical protein